MCVSPSLIIYDFLSMALSLFVPTESSTHKYRFIYIKKMLKDLLGTIFSCGLIHIWLLTQNYSVNVHSNKGMCHPV